MRDRITVKRAIRHDETIRPAGKIGCYRTRDMTLADPILIEYGIPQLNYHSKEFNVIKDTLRLVEMTNAIIFQKLDVDMQFWVEVTIRRLAPIKLKLFKALTQINQLDIQKMEIDMNSELLKGKSDKNILSGLQIQINETISILTQKVILLTGEVDEVIKAGRRLWENQTN